MIIFCKVLAKARTEACRSQMLETLGPFWQLGKMFVDWMMQYKEPRDVRMFADLLLQEVNYLCIQGMLYGSGIVCIDDSYPVCCFSNGTNQNFINRGIFLVILCLDLSMILAKASGTWVGRFFPRCPQKNTFLKLLVLFLSYLPLALFGSILDFPSLCSPLFYQFPFHLHHFFVLLS